MEICECVENSNIKIYNKIKGIAEETNIKTNKISYVWKQYSCDARLNKKVPLIIKQKERQNVKKTKEELNSEVDPVNLKISSVENRTLVIQTENVEER